MMKLNENDTAILNEIINQHIPEYEIWAFGSRVHGKNVRPFSDLDLVIKNPPELPFNKQAALMQAINDSDISIRIDLSEWARLPEWMQKKIETEHITLTKPIGA